MVFYRKYRPQKIDDLDSSAVRESLFSVLAKDVPHAFLFTGPKGLGKTSTARIVAKAVNCTSRAINEEPRMKNKEQKGKILSSQSLVQSAEGLEPCNTCDACVSITNGTNLDVIEIDAASNRGIDEIRDLKEKIRLAPVSAKKKIYIIDEVHMLTTEAFNALLKTLEEPPSHAVFILCTTESHKLPATIVSRCFHIPFRLATTEELTRSFRRIAEGENVAIEDDALSVIAGLAEGGFRDGAKILEELVLLAHSAGSGQGGGKKLTKEFVEEKYQVSSIKYQVVALFEALGKKDAKQGLEVIQKVTEQGVDVKYFLQQVMEALHQGLLQKTGISNFQFPISNFQFTIGEIKELFDLFSKAYADMKFAVLPQLPLELAIIEYAEMISTDSKVNSDSHRLPENLQKSDQKSVGITDLRRQVGEMQKNKALYGEPKPEPKQVIATMGVDLMKAPRDGEVTKEWQEALWKSIIAEMKSYNHTIAGVLRSCGIKSYSKELLIIEAGYKFHKERLEDMKTREALTKVCKMLTGNEIKIGVELRS